MVKMRVEVLLVIPLYTRLDKPILVASYSEIISILEKMQITAVIMRQ